MTDEHHEPMYVLQRGQDDVLHNPVPFRCCLAQAESTTKFKKRYFHALKGVEHRAASVSLVCKDKTRYLDRH